VAASQTNRSSVASPKAHKLPHVAVGPSKSFDKICVKQLGKSSERERIEVSFGIEKRMSGNNFKKYLHGFATGSAGKPRIFQNETRQARAQSARLDVLLVE
jgi:hypothetical protein